MKVIRADSYDDEGPRGTQRLVAGPGLTPKEADAIAKRLNDDPQRSEYDWFRVVEDDYVLFKFEP